MMNLKLDLEIGFRLWLRHFYMLCCLIERYWLIGRIFLLFFIGTRKKWWPCPRYTNFWILQVLIGTSLTSRTPTSSFIVEIRPNLKKVKRFGSDVAIRKSLGLLFFARTLPRFEV